MKHLKFAGIALALFLISHVSTHGQDLDLGLKIGVAQSKLQDIQDNPSGYGQGGSVLGYQAGLYGRISLAGFFIQPEALYTNTGGEIELPNGKEDIRFQKFDVPVLVGKKFLKILRVNVGPVASFNINQASDVENFEKDDIKGANFGYQAGVGLDIGNVIVDLKYEGNLSAVGENVRIGGEDYSTDMRTSVWWLSVGFKLF